MPNINKSKVVSYPQNQMYELVNDVESYSEFVPFCSESRINSCTHEEIRATLSFARGGFSKSFTTLNRLQPYRIIKIQLINGPFRKLEGFWCFGPLDGDRCRISLDLEFEFASCWLGLTLMFGSLFNQMATRLVDTFCERADVVYGKKA
ncbi:type II toxin-antitoxin system RatA family toxin [Coxiella endosymbiont of Ornithodoros amblus]|uniref:type II toxin-antitoxin system RatA family toxin n=1 Tax=Coxiella endosymbiont of Ornithodoros amblus TaxID=1656166 RepID=UPI00244DD7F6|nr:type II toxin-antitoxin system RatA family toxin [Coxiella endosymbiont of Ornithodoros amblus]MBW5803112.1 type II toxin-antitoxin system RatA family toxin [Coxiella endosymbiont of Ornithodoros amblus]